MLITQFHELQTEAQAVQDFLEEEIQDDINILSERGSLLSNYIARTGKMLADAKYHLNRAQGDKAIEVIEKIFGQELKLSAKVQNAFIEGLVKEEQYLVNWIERLNKTATHQIEWCRTLISKAKEEMKYING